MSRRTVLEQWRTRALRAVIRAVPRGRYPVMSRLAPSRGQLEAHLARDAGGARFHCDLADQIQREVCFTGLYEPSVTRVFQQQLTPGGIAVDVGANWGYFTLIAAPVVGSAGRVIALEPDPRQHQALLKNIESNGFAHVTAHRAAASSATGRVTLAGYHDAAANRGVSRIALADDDPSAPRFEADATTIDELTRELPRVDIVKIDVEGAEDLVLDGMREGLAARRYRAVLLELHPDALRGRGVAPERCFDALADAGYRGATIDGSAAAYRRALDPATTAASLLGPLDAWRASIWPHLLWLC